MLNIKCICPYCSNEGSIVESLGPIRESKDEERGGVKKRIVSTYAVANCCKCSEVFIVFFNDLETSYKQAKEALQNWEKFYRLRPQIERTLPEPEEAPVEEVYPEKVNSLLKVIHKLFKELPFLNPEEELPAQTATIVSTIRSVLEYSLKYLNIGNEGDSLYQRIEKAYEEGYITKVIKDWAHIVRKWGNKAVHELEITPGEAMEAYEFMKFMLFFLFKVPAEVEKYKLKDHDNSPQSPIPPQTS